GDVPPSPWPAQDVVDGLGTSLRPSMGGGAEASRSPCIAALCTCSGALRACRRVPGHPRFYGGRAMKRKATTQTPTKLKLDRETLRALQPPDLAEVAAAAGTTSKCHSGVTCCIGPCSG